MTDSGTKATTNAEVHLKRAAKLLKELDETTQEFKKHVDAYAAQCDASEQEPFLRGLASQFRGTQRLKQHKAALLNDLRIAEEELNLAVAADGEARLPPPDNPLSAATLRAMVRYSQGYLEMISGSDKEARRLLDESIAIDEIADAHYLLGLLDEFAYRPAEALAHFKQYLALEPNGEFSSSALREADAMRRYRKRFRGSWLLFIFLLFCWVIPGVIYFFVKFK